jgi:hypothetical protein
MNRYFNMLNATILLFVFILMLIMALPAFLARLYGRKATKSARPEGGVYPMPQTCWLFTRAGIIVSVWALLAIPPFIFILKHFVTEWFDIHRANDTRDMVSGFLICIVYILVALSLWWSYITDFKTHKDDYIHLFDEKIEFRNGNKTANILLNKIQKFEAGRRGYNIHVENGEMILIPYKFINNLIGGNELKVKLKELASSLSN